MRNKKQIAELFKEVLGFTKGNKIPIDKEHKIKFEKILLRVALNNIKFKDNTEFEKFTNHVLNIKSFK